MEQMFEVETKQILRPPGTNTRSIFAFCFLTASGELENLFCESYNL